MITLSSHQRTFLLLMLDLQDRDIFNNGMKSMIVDILKRGKYIDDDNVYNERYFLIQLTKQYNWWLNEGEKGNRVTSTSHLDIKFD